MKLLGRLLMCSLGSDFPLHFWRVSVRFGDVTRDFWRMSRAKRWLWRLDVFRKSRIHSLVLEA